MAVEKPSSNPWTAAPINAIPSSLHLDDDVFDLTTFSSRIIDIGCGAGRVCFDFLGRGWIDVTGIDINAPVVSLAQGLARELGLQPAGFQVADARETGLPQSHYDLALMQALLTVLGSATDRIKVLMEARRILKPGGKLYIADFIQAWHDPRYRQRYANGFERYGEQGTFLASDGAGFEYVAHHFAEKEIVEALLKIGFEVETFRYRRVRTRSGNQLFGFIAVCR